VYKQTFNRLSSRLFNRLTTGWISVYMMQPVVQPVVNGSNNRLTTGCIV